MIRALTLQASNAIVRLPGPKSARQVATVIFASRQVRFDEKERLVRSTFCLILAGMIGFAATAELPVQPGDVAFGLSNGSAGLTLEQVRDGALLSNWTAEAYLQSVEFDNYDGVYHNAAGNLLALNFGTSSSGGSLFNVSTDGSDVAEFLFAFDGGAGAFGTTQTRIGGLSVSPNNGYIAALGYDTGKLIVLEYVAGATPGAGSGALINDAWEVTATANTEGTYGTAWLDDNTVLAYVWAGDTDVDLVTFPFDPVNGLGAGTVVATITQAASGEPFTDVEYNPQASPYVFVATGLFAGDTYNNVTVLDPADWSVVASIGLSNSCETLREIALGPNNLLYLAQYSSRIDTLDISDPATLPANSSENYWNSSTFAIYDGIDVAFGTAATTGACCFPDDTCEVLTEADCIAGGGEFRGAGTDCDIPGICDPIVGACCLPEFGCNELTEADCLALDGEYLGDLVPCGPEVCLGNYPVEVGDLAFGLSAGSAFTTADHARKDPNDPTRALKIDRWTSFAYLQSVEFDNLGGVLHNAAGNLLALNFGAGFSEPPEETQGGYLYNLSTDGSDEGEELYHWNMLTGGVEDDRVVGLSVSPGNDYIACFGSDTQNVYILEYNAGGTPGTGSGASIGNVIVVDSILTDTYSQGTTWLDDDTVLLYAIDVFSPGLTLIYTIDLVGGGSVEVNQVATVTVFGGGTQHTDIEYNPTFSPYVYCFHSGFENPLWKNTLSVVDPADWSTIAFARYDNSINTGREIALGPDGRLYASQYAGGQADPRVYVDYIQLDDNGDNFIDATDIAATLADDNSVDYYYISGGNSSIYNGLDVACGIAITGACCVGEVCQQLTADECLMADGFYLGDGTGCSDTTCVTLPCDTIEDVRIPAEQLPIPTKLCDVIVSSTTDLVSSSNSKSFQLQDATGGITVFGSNDIIDGLFAFPIAEGDQITIEGTVSTFNGLLQLTDDSLRYLTVISNAGQVGVPAPIELTSLDFADGSATAELYESMIVKVSCVRFLDTGTFAGGQNYDVVDELGQFVVRIATDDLDIVGTQIPTDYVDITGILSQFDTSDPRDGGYQLLPRSLGDMVVNPDCATGPVGACCLPDFTCIENATESECVLVSGVWYEGETCDICPPPAGCDNIIISEVVDGNLPGGIPKWVEITNCGTEDCDLSNYSIGNFNNGNLDLGGGAATQLMGILPAGESYVYEYDNPEGSRFEEVYGFPSDQFSSPDGQGTSGRYVNGDDVIALFLGIGRTEDGVIVEGSIVDVYGVRGVDGTGEVWEYADGYSYRLPDALASDTFDPAEWFFGGPNSLDSGNGEADDIILLQTLTTPSVHDCGVSDPCEGQLLGDANCDGLVNNFDIDAFVLALTSGQAAWESMYGDECDFLCVNDVDGNGMVNNFDIDPFVAILTGGK